MRRSAIITILAIGIMTTSLGAALGLSPFRYAAAQDDDDDDGRIGAFDLKDWCGVSLDGGSEQTQAP